MKPLLVIGWFLAGSLVLGLALAASARIHQFRRLAACSEELDAAVRSAKTFQAFTRDPRPDGLMRRYSHPERSELMAHVSTRAHTPKDAADVKEMANRAQSSAVFLFGDMAYVLFFDGDDRLREFVCLSN